MTTYTGVEGDITMHRTLLASGESAELPTDEGSFEVEVRRAVQAYDCTPDNAPPYPLMYAYTVAFHAD